MLLHDTIIHLNLFMPAQICSHHIQCDTFVHEIKFKNHGRSLENFKLLIYKLKKIVIKSQYYMNNILTQKSIINYLGVV